MREWLFRAKSIEGNKWVYGNLVTLYYPKQICIAHEGNNQNWSNTCFTEIKEETIGVKFNPDEKCDEPNFNLYQGDIIGEMLGNHLVKYEVKFNGTHFGGWGIHNKCCLYLHPFRFKDCILLGTIHDEKGN